MKNNTTKTKEKKIHKQGAERSCLGHRITYQTPAIGKLAPIVSAIILPRLEVGRGWRTPLSP
jgi:hypothetical protein